MTYIELISFQLDVQVSASKALISFGAGSVKNVPIAWFYDFLCTEIAWN